MTALLVLLDGAVTIAAGALVVGLVRTRLRPLEMLLLALVIGVVCSSAATFALALVAGLNAATVIAGPLWVCAIAVLVSRWTASPWQRWRDTLVAARARWRGRSAVSQLVLAAVTALLAALVYGHTMFVSDGALSAGYETVWADWSQHLTTAASFAVAGNLPPTNPLFSGTALLYPFLPDFHAATLMALGLGEGPALALPSAVMAAVLVLLVVCVAQRLRLGFGAGVVAAAICVLGGGLGVVGLFADSCSAHAYTATQCTLQYALGHPAAGAGIIGWTLHDLPGTIAAQPRAYDGLLTAQSLQPLPNMQWYTPLFAWWLPQRTMLFGFVVALAVLVLVLAARSAGPDLAAFAIAGLLLGLLPLVHVQTLIVMVLLLLVLALRRPQRQWLALLAVAAVVAAPRLVQIALSAHGSAADGNAYPWLEPGWLADGSAAQHLALSASGVGTALLAALRQLVSGQWWSFWVLNLGVAVPLSALLALCVLARRAPGGAGALARRLLAPLPLPLLELFGASLIVFALCNIVVFQSWDWDNTKLLVYWYLMVGLVVGAIATHLWRRWWRAVVAVALPGSMLITGIVVVLRLLPWTPAADSVTGPYVVASASERALAATVARETQRGAVFLTSGRPNDPLLAVAGRTAVMGYYGWVWSYGIVMGSRAADERTMYAGCSDVVSCPVAFLLRRYGISFVEVDDRTGDPGAIGNVATDWWASQGFPIVARSDHITVYDVRGE